MRSRLLRRVPFAGSKRSWGMIRRWSGRITEKLGVDQALIATLAARSWVFLVGPVNLVIVASRLSPEQQGFYYTFASIMALQVFLDMGLSYVLVQFISHEFAKLHWVSKGGVEGETESVGRLVQILIGAAKWYAVAALLLVILLTPLGIVFLGLQDLEPGAFAWRLPWSLFVIASALNLLLIPVLSALEAGGRVAEVNRLRLVQGVLSSCVGWTVLLSGGGLFVSCANGFTAFVIAASWLGLSKTDLVRSIYTTWRTSQRVHLVGRTFDWWRELWPMQWRIAISWMSGYFIFQLYNPVLFYYSGTVAAGQMGMTLTLTNTLSQIAIAWVYVKIPIFGVLVANSNWRELDMLFSRVLARSMVVVVSGAVVGIGGIWLLQQYTSVGQRFLRAPEAALIFGAVVLNNIIAALSIYLRAHKRDPFAWLSVIGAVLAGLSTWFLGARYSSAGIVVGAFMINLLYGVPTAVWLWSTRRREWHQEVAVPWQS